MSNFIVGLTGGIGSGKTFVSDMFAELGVDIIDADVIARQAVSQGQPAFLKIVERFGQAVVGEDKQLNRDYLRQHVFSHPEDKAWLNGLLHPLIREQMKVQCQQATSDYCILAIPLLVENKLQAMVNRVLVIDVPEELQMQRATQRDNNSAEQIKKIMAAQVDRQSRLAAADDVIDNSGDLLALKHQVSSLHQAYLEKAKTYAKA